MERDGRLKGVTELAPAEMAMLRGGDDSGSGGTGFAYDLGKILGGLAGGLWWVITNPPEASYSYGKVGY